MKEEGFEGLQPRVGEGARQGGSTALTRDCMPGLTQKIHQSTGQGRDRNKAVFLGRREGRERTSSRSNYMLPFCHLLFTSGLVKTERLKKKWRKTPHQI